MTEEDGSLPPIGESIEHWRQSIGLWLGPLVFVIIYFLPFPGLCSAAHHLGAMLGQCLSGQA